MANAVTLNQHVRRDRTDREAFNKHARGVAKSFKTQRQRFDGLNKAYEPLNDQPENQLPTETKEVGTTVTRELDFFRPFFAAAVNSAMQKEISNAGATAELVLFGNSFGDVPVSALINLEQKLKQFKATLKEIPTLNDNQNWEVASSQNGTYKVVPDKWAYRTTSQPFAFEKAPASKDGKHKAQVDIIQRDVNVGRWTTRTFSGAATIDSKIAALRNVDEAIKTVVEAREQANLAAVTPAPDFSGIYDAIVAPITEPFTGSGTNS